jgi:hypothetical protein
MKRKIHLKEKYYYLQYNKRILPLIQRSLSQWKRHFQFRLSREQQLFQDRYQKKFLTTIMKTWRKYLQTKYLSLLRQFKEWKWQFQLKKWFSCWRKLYKEKQLFILLQIKSIKRQKKNIFNQWKVIVHKIVKEKSNFYQIQRKIFHRKYFQTWHEKVRYFSSLFCFLREFIFSHFCSLVLVEEETTVKKGLSTVHDQSL